MKYHQNSATSKLARRVSEYSAPLNSPSGEKCLLRGIAQAAGRLCYFAHNMNGPIALRASLGLCLTPPRAPVLLSGVAEVPPTTLPQKWIGSHQVASGPVLPQTPATGRFLDLEIA